MAEDKVDVQKNWKEKVEKALDGMLYISESEAPLILLNSFPMADLAEIQKFVAQDAGAATEMQELIAPKQFLDEIHRAADPGDLVIQGFAKRFDELFEILHEGGALVYVIRVNDPQQVIYIAAARPNESVVIKTETVET